MNKLYQNLGIFGEREDFTRRRKGAKDAEEDKNANTSRRGAGARGTRRKIRTRILHAEARRRGGAEDAEEEEDAKNSHKGTKDTKSTKFLSDGFS